MFITYNMYLLRQVSMIPNVGRIFASAGTLCIAAMQVVACVQPSSSPKTVQSEQDIGAVSGVRVDDSIAALLEAWWKEDNQCREERIPEAKEVACDSRETLGRRIEAHAWCFIENPEVVYQPRWRQCDIPTTDASSNRLTAREQANADRLALAYSRDRLIQAEVDRQLAEAERSRIQSELAALRRIP